MLLRIVPLFFWIVVGYLTGTVLSNHIYMDLSRTHWANLWVYFWMFLWPVGLAYFVLYYLLILIVIILVGLFIAGRVFKVGPFAPDTSW